VEEIHQEEHAEEEISDTSEQPAKPEHDNSSEVEDSPEWETPPYTPPESDDEGCCIPSLKRLSRQTPPHIITPPVSPPTTFSKPALIYDSEKEPEGSITPAPSSRPISPKRHSLIQSIRKRLSKTSAKFRITRRIRSLEPEPPLPIMTPEPKEKRRRPSSRASTADIQTVLEGPVLKLNRMSDMSLPLTAAERKEMDRRRAHESKLTEDFDLVLRLGTLRNPPKSPTRQDMEAFIAMGPSEGSSNPADPSEIPPVPMIEPEYFTSPTSPRSQTTNLNHTASNSSRTSRPRSKRAGGPRRKSVQHPGPIPVRPFVPVRNVLSEDNLRLLNEMSSSTPAPPVPPMPTSSAAYTRTRPSIRRRKYIPSDNSSINSGQIPVPPIATAARRRSSQRSQQGRRYPSMDYFPLAQTTALGLKGGRIGLVQMGSPRKANKILGDIVLIVPEQEYAPGGKRRRRSRKDLGPGIVKRGSIGPTASPRGSRAKVEKLRGEKLPVGTFGEGSEFPRLNTEPMVEVGRPSMEKKASVGVDTYMDRRPSADHQSSLEKQSMDYRTSMDGRRSAEGRLNVESRASMDHRMNIESKTDLEHKATVESRASMERMRSVDSRTDFERKAAVESRASIDHRMNVESRASIERMRSVDSRDFERKAAVESRASIDRRMNIESRASIDRMRSVESRASIDRLRNVESRADLERKSTIESRANNRRETQVESRASIDRRTTVESRGSESRGSGSLERKGTLELNRPKSKGAVWII